MEPKTLKLKGTVTNMDISILIDSGSTHKIVDIIVVKKLNPFVYPTKELTITTAYVQQVKGVGRCYKFLYKYRTCNYKQDFTVYHLGGWIWCEE